MAASSARAGVSPVAEEAVIAGSGVVESPAAAVSFAAVVGAVVAVIALGIDEADAAVHLFGAVQILGGAGIAHMLAHPEKAVIIAIAKLVVLAVFSRFEAGALVICFNTGGIGAGAAGVGA
jgi:hypothetical protein